MRQNSNTGQERTFSIPAPGGNRQEQKSFKRKAHIRQLLGSGNVATGGREGNPWSGEAREPPGGRDQAPGDITMSRALCILVSHYLILLSHQRIKTAL